METLVTRTNMMRSLAVTFLALALAGPAFGDQTDSPTFAPYTKAQTHDQEAPHEQFGQSSERGALLDQLELQLADLEENAARADTAAQMAAEKSFGHAQERILAQLNEGVFSRSVRSVLRDIKARTSERIIGRH